MSEEPACAVARPIRASVYHAPGAIDADGTGEHAGDEAPAMAAGNAETPALFADDSSGSREDATPDGQRDHAPRPGAVPVDTDLANAGEVPTAFEAQVPTPNGPARAPGEGDSLTAAATAGLADAKPEARPATPAASPALPALPPEVRFASANHENIVTSMRADLMPNGGSMRIRLDPPQLGALQVTVQIRDGLVTASFETTSDEATRLLGHSLNQLKTVLEAQGVAVDKLQVQQAPRETQTSGRHDDGRREQGSPSQNARQEQQRREMLQRMWRRLAGGQDPLDLTA
jgi:flagellar hook-length control protein FliK